jgi:hypothetical protein
MIGGYGSARAVLLVLVAGAPAFAQGDPAIEDAFRRVLADGGYATDPPPAGPEAAAPVSDRSSSQDSGGPSLLASGLRAWFWIVGAASLVALAVAGAALADRVARRRAGAAQHEAKNGAPATTPSAQVASRTEAPEEDFEAAAAASRYADALRALLAAALRRAFSRPPPPSLTARAAVVRAETNAAARAELARLVAVIERVRYAGGSADETAWRDARATYDRFVHAVGASA